MLFGSNAKLREAYILRIAPKSKDVFNISTDEKGFHEGLMVFDNKDRLLKNITGTAHKGFCMYDDNDGYQEWNVTNTPDRDKNNGYLVRECYIIISYSKPEKEVDTIEQGNGVYKGDAYYKNYVYEIIDIFYHRFYEGQGHLSDVPVNLKKEAFYEWLNEQIKNTTY